MAVINAVADAFDSTKTYITAGGHSFVIDEPAPFGGEDTAPSPVAMLLGSLAGCINAIGQWVANEMNFKIKHLPGSTDCRSIQRNHTKQSLLSGNGIVAQ